MNGSNRIQEIEQETEHPAERALPVTLVEKLTANPLTFALTFVQMVVG